jgi:hypothetical protein
VFDTEVPRRIFQPKDEELYYIHPGNEEASSSVRKADCYVIIRKSLVQRTSGIHMAVGDADIFTEGLFSVRLPTQGITYPDSWNR